MYEELLELILPTLVTGIYAVLATVFAGLGVLFEYKSAMFLSGGEMFIGLWAGAVGLILLSGSARVTNDKLLTAYESLRS